MGTFGTTINPAHFVETPDPTNVAGQPARMIRPVAGTVLKVQNPSGGTPLADITTGAYGYWAATYSGVDSILVSADGGTSWVGPLFSAEIMAAAKDAATSAAAAAASAAAVIANLSAQISSAVNGDPVLKESLRGPQGVPGLNDYQTWLGQGNFGTYADYQLTKQGPKGDAGPSNTGYTPPWDLGVTAGYVTPFIRVPASATGGWKITACQSNTDVPTTTAAKVQLVRRVGSTDTDLLPSGSEITMAAGQKEIYQALTSVSIPAGSSIAARLVTAPSTGGGTSTPDAAVVGHTQYGNGLTTTANTHVPTMPTGGATGDVVVIICPEQSNNTTIKCLSGSFAEVKRTGSAATPQLSGLMFAAPWSGSLDLTLKTYNSSDGTTPVLRSVVATVLILRGVTASAPFSQADLGSGGNNTGAVRTGSDVVEAAATAFGLSVEYFRLPADVTITTPIGVTGGPSGAAVLENPVSANVGGVNVGMVVRTVPGVAAGGTYPSTTYTLTQNGGAGAISGATHVSGYFGEPKGTSVTGVGKMTVFLEFEKL